MARSCRPAMLVARDHRSQRISSTEHAARAACYRSMLPPCPDSFRSRSSWGCAVRVINILSHRWHSEFVSLAPRYYVRYPKAIAMTRYHELAGTIRPSWRRGIDGRKGLFCCAKTQFEQDWPALAFTRSATVCSPDKFFLDSWVERPQPGATPGEFVLVLIDMLSRLRTAVKACVSEGRSAPPRPPTAYASRLPRRGTTASYSAPLPTPLTPPRATRSAGPP